VRTEWIIWALVSVVALGCTKAAQVRTEDVNAWRGTPLMELQVHPLFSTIPKAVEPLSDGSELWTYSNCISRRSARVCNPVGTSMICSGGQANEVCCYNQFLVQGDHVIWYRPIGSCYTDCSTRPSSDRCASEK
jgi:hypothetical protein